MRPAAVAIIRCVPLPGLVTIQNMQKARCWSNLAIPKCCVPPYLEEGVPRSCKVRAREEINADVRMLPRSTQPVKIDEAGER